MNIDNNKPKLREYEKELKRKPNLIEDISKKIGKALQIEFSKDINNPNIGIIGAIRKGKKVVKFYNVDRNKYTPKLKLKEVSHNKSDLEELECNSEFIGELVFYNNESIESLICVLKELYEV